MNKAENLNVLKTLETFRVKLATGAMSGDAEWAVRICQAHIAAEHFNSRSDWTELLREAAEPVKEIKPINPAVKTYEQWSESRQDLSKFLQIGDLVDEEIAEYFINVLPPACMSGGIVQIGEPSDHVEGHATYETLKRTSDGWQYAGTCHRGQTEHKAGETITWNS